jgi:predicted DNA-binding WGR domain protein
MDIKFIGWCKDADENHDKVWGIIRRSEYEYAMFWGRRGKKLQTKIKEMDNYAAGALIRSKRNKGYVEVPKDEVNACYESFGKDLFKLALKVG